MDALKYYGFFSRIASNALVVNVEMAITYIPNENWWTYMKGTVFVSFDEEIVNFVGKFPLIWNTHNRHMQRKWKSDEHTLCQHT